MSEEKMIQILGRAERSAAALPIRHFRSGFDATARALGGTTWRKRIVLLEN